MCTLAELGWVVYFDIPSRNIAASIITGVAAVTLGMWFLHTERKWGSFLMGGSGARLYDPGPQVRPPSHSDAGSEAGSERSATASPVTVDRMRNRRDDGPVGGNNNI
jgi:hypothetical protein